MAIRTTTTITVETSVAVDGVKSGTFHLSNLTWIVRVCSPTTFNWTKINLVVADTASTSLKLVKILVPNNRQYKCVDVLAKSQNGDGVATSCQVKSYRSLWLDFARPASILCANHVSSSVECVAYISAVIANFSAKGASHSCVADVNATVKVQIASEIN